MNDQIRLLKEQAKAEEQRWRKMSPEDRAALHAAERKNMGKKKPHGSKALNVKEEEKARQIAENERKKMEYLRELEAKKAQQRTEREQALAKEQQRKEKEAADAAAILTLSQQEKRRQEEEYDKERAWMAHAMTEEQRAEYVTKVQASLRAVQEEEQKKKETEEKIGKDREAALQREVDEKKALQSATRKTALQTKVEELEALVRNHEDEMWLFRETGQQYAALNKKLNAIKEHVQNLTITSNKKEHKERTLPFGKNVAQGGIQATAKRKTRLRFVVPQHSLSLALCFPELLDDEHTFARLQRAQGLLLPNLSDDATLHILSFLTPVRVSTMLRCSKAFFITVLRLTPHGVPSVPQHICITRVPYWVILPQEAFHVPIQSFTLACMVRSDSTLYACSNGRQTQTKKRCIIGRNDYFSFGTVDERLVFTSIDRRRSCSQHKLPARKWVYLSCVCTSDTVTFYIDGKQLDTVPFTPLSEAAQGPVCIGGCPAPRHEYWQGGLAWVHVVPKVLENESRIQELFKVGYEGRTAGWFPQLAKATDSCGEADLVWKEVGTKRCGTLVEEHHNERRPHPLWHFSWESTFVTSRGVLIKQVVGGGW